MRKGPAVAGADSRNEHVARPLNSADTGNPVALQSVVLREYQERGVAAVRRAYLKGSTAVVYVLPTGGGKTVMFIHVLAATVARGKRVVVLVHRIELVAQVVAALDLHGVRHGIIASGSVESEAPVQVAMIATLVRRLDRWRDRFDLIVVDESHHSVAGTWARSWRHSQEGTCWA